MFLKSKLFVVVTMAISFGSIAQTKKPQVVAKPTPSKAPTVQKAQPAVVTRQVVVNNPMSHLDSVSYAIGANIGQSLKGQNLSNLSIDLISKGISDIVNNASLKISADKLNGIIQGHMQKAFEEKNKGVKDASEKYLITNKTKAGVTTTSSGLQYEVLTQGAGPKPSASDRVKVHYVGKLINGEEFDSSIRRGEPATFGVGEVIKGWTEALQLMNTGTKLKLTIPQDIAYGSYGSPPNIPPFSTLIFEVELIEIVK